METRFRVMTDSCIPDKEEQDLLWELYKKVFENSEKICAQNQCCYTRDLFISALEDTDYWKCVSYKDKTPVGMLLFTNNLEKARVAYINPEKFQMMFPDFLPDKIYYFTFLGIAPEYQATGAFYELCSVGMLITFVQLKGIAALDFSQETKAKHLPSMLAKVSRQLLNSGAMPFSVLYKQVGVQEFGALLPETNPNPGP